MDGQNENISLTKHDLRNPSAEIDLLEYLKRSESSFLLKLKKEGSLISLSDEEIGFFKNVISDTSTAAEKLGLVNPVSPPVDKIYFIERKAGRVQAAVYGFKIGILIFVDNRSQIENQETVLALNHELYHYFTREKVAKREIPFESSFLGLDKTEYIGSSYGFTRIKYSNYGYPTRVGVLGESLADLFEAYCNKDKNVLIKGYEPEDVFTISLISDWAKKKNLKPNIVLENILLKNLQQDFTVFKEIKDIYGTDFVRKVNSYDNFDAFEILTRQEQLFDISKAGGFEADMTGMKRLIGKRKIISVNDLGFQI